MSKQEPLPIYEDHNFKLIQSPECNLPGYLILFVKPQCRSLAELEPDLAIQLMQLLQQAQQVIQRVIQPERIYLCSFCELNPQLHYHIFPRTLAVTEQYQAATQTHEVGIDGLKLLDWAKQNYQSSLTDEERFDLHQRLQSAFVHEAVASGGEEI